MTDSQQSDLPIYETKAEAQLTLSSTVPQYIARQPGFRYVDMYGSAAFKWQPTPGITVVLYYTGATGVYKGLTERYKDYVTDKVSTTHMPLDAMLTGDKVYLCLTDTITGLYITIDGTNKNAIDATLDVEYWNGTAWTDVANDVDATKTGNATLNKTGAYTFDVPSDAETTVNGITGRWIRFNPSTTLSATIDIIEIIPICKGANYLIVPATTRHRENLHFVKASGIQVLSVTATPTLDITWLRV